ncbi:MAG: ankyrin repeat domain-containing protein [Synergistaceae bacterium]|jgi:ankyrin repeat protein|nr:ankyrin repeat domain-containing protein [Synergistaceae bacterium]
MKKHGWVKWIVLVVVILLLRAPLRFLFPEKVRAVETRSTTTLADTVETQAVSDDISILEKYGPDINAKNEDGLTPLLQAIKAHRREELPVLIEAGADVNAKDNRGKNALQYVLDGSGHQITREQVEERVYKPLSLLLAAGADVHARDNRGATALLDAARAHWAVTINLLLDAGADKDINIQNTYDGDTALIRASFQNTNDVVAELLKRGADVNARNNDGMTALMAAVFNQKNELTIDLLLKAGVNPNARSILGHTALMLSVMNQFRSPQIYNHYLYDTYQDRQQDAIVTVLLATDADAGVRDMDGCTVIDYAKETNVLMDSASIAKLKEAVTKSESKSKNAQPDFFGLCEFGTREEIIEALEKGANPNDRDSDGWPAFMLMLRRKADPALTEAMIEKGADVNASIYGGLTPLMASTFDGCDNGEIALLVKAGADVGAVRNNGENALALAVSNSKQTVSLIQAFLDAGVDIKSIKTSIGGILYDVISNGEDVSEIVKVLLNHGVDVNGKEGSYGEPLIAASRKSASLNGIKTLQIILEAGANVSESPRVLSYAVEIYKASPDAVALLLKYGADVNVAVGFDKKTPLMSVLKSAGDHIKRIKKIKESYHWDWEADIKEISARLPVIVEMLLDAGADVNAKDRDGKRAIDYVSDIEEFKTTDAYRKLAKLSEKS